MKTIGAKELRLHLDEILDKVIAGEDIIVRHRFKDPVRLSAARSQKKHTKKLAGLQAFDSAAKHASPFDKRKSIKELYNDSISQKYAK